MNHDEKNHFGKLLTDIAELYGKKMSPTFLSMYWEVLSMYSLNEIEWAARCHMANPDSGHFMPKPADFVRYLEGNSHEKSLQAWSKIIAAAKTIGAYDSVIFDDPAIHCVVRDMGGWVTICHSQESQLPFLFQEFSQRYVSCLKEKPNSIPKLSGIYSLPKPRLILKDN